MTESQSPTSGQTPDNPPTQSASLHASHAPAVPSPLNPEAKRPTVKAPAREQREKKESLKKRESNASNTRGGTPDAKGRAVGAKCPPPSAPSPMRFSIPEPKAQDYEPSRDYVWQSHEPTPFFTPDEAIELKKPLDQYCAYKSTQSRRLTIPLSAQNTKGYRYTHCVADPLFRHKQFYRTSEVRPYGPKMSVEDSDRWIHFDESCTYVTNEKGWRTSKSNVFAREGRLYYEVKIVRGISPDASIAPPGGEPTPQPHIRVGWARREANNDAPVGFDGYSYGITDIHLKTMHRSRPGKIYIPQPKKAAGKKRKADEVKDKQQNDTKADQEVLHLREGDVLGLLITLPSLSLHKKVVDGIYNPAVDTTDGFSDPLPSQLSDIIRDRIPVPYRGNIYFESFEYTSSKPVESYSDRAPLAMPQQPHPNAEETALRSLPGSNIRVWRNGKEIGTAFEGLLAFLPPASVSSAAGAGGGSGGGTSAAAGASGKGTREVDDGTLGYYPTVSAFAGGIAQVNFGPEFWCPPEGLQFTPSSDTTVAGAGGSTSVSGLATDVMMTGTEAQVTEEEAETARREREAELKRKPRAIGERYKEQIAEDILWDIIDEACFFTQDGGYSYVPEKESAVAGAVKGDTRAAALGRFEA